MKDYILKNIEANYDDQIHDIFQEKLYLKELVEIYQDLFQKIKYEYNDIKCNDMSEFKICLSNIDKTLNKGINLDIIINSYNITLTLTRGQKGFGCVDWDSVKLHGGHIPDKALKMIEEFNSYYHF